MSTPHRHTQMRALEQFAVLQWQHLNVAARHGIACEHEQARSLCTALHAARMVLSGRAARTADWLYDIAWLRLMDLSRQLDAKARRFEEAA